MNTSNKTVVGLEAIGECILDAIGEDNKVVTETAYVLKPEGSARGYLCVLKEGDPDGAIIQYVARKTNRLLEASHTVPWNELFIYRGSQELVSLVIDPFKLAAMQQYYHLIVAQAKLHNIPLKGHPDQVFESILGMNKIQAIGQSAQAFKISNSGEGLGATTTSRNAKKEVRVAK